MVKRPNRYRPVPNAYAKADRRDGAPQARRSRPFLEFLNSPLGLWILSSLFLTAGSWGYTEWTQRRSEEKRREQQIERLDIEIESRLDYGSPMMAASRLLRQKTLEYEPADVAAMPAQVLLAPGRGSEVFPEFANRNLRSLLVELGSLVKDYPDRLCLDRAILSERHLRFDWLGKPLRPDEVGKFSHEVGQLADERWSTITQSLRLIRRYSSGEGSAETVPYCEAVEKEREEVSANANRPRP